MIATLILSAVCLASAIAACVFLHRATVESRALRKSMDAHAASGQQALKAMQDLRPPEPTRDERIAQLRGVIQGTRAIELTLGQDPVDLQAKLVLAGERARAARAREKLKALGIEL